MLIDAEQAFAQQSEHTLIERVKSGDQVAYAALYELHVKRVYSLCLRLIADKEHAEDATQEVFVQLWHKIANFDGRSQFTTWLHSVTSNIAISYIRKHKNWLQKVVSFEQSGMDEQSAADCQGLNGLDKLVLRLPERARMVFVLHAIEGYRHEEIASMLDMAVGSSKSQFHRARQLLKEWYENE
ncbi:MULTISPECIES: RNA polymerase sigma factor [Pseudoalteromonas]|jgi:RNA polymerase sigma-70 factor (ECF subfamily)|uniref:RNA polymerase sigma-70 factor, ECF subfamily n=1 Tax=Pseudoalteromonas lipolytica TaxID=570156 RepID=A0AAD0S1Z2_9GAMM|nr:MULTISPECIES: sigma-70 family RNA polymerase sigma factor [Pseudoalteromonas]AXV66357.1 sigma-70 family RNA polymerase sigma factor [Pseudoalteromonas donghaensis]EWH04993.1 RNA polymerase sigma 70 [Pseudoalteromonas lipolytica SCSIO 04301]MAE01098.1 RNA polymerase subunit sigma-70 [Pseudoalteromonas sp.]MBE0349756.1 RNA polymerase sigma-70 factor, ECF subfamily [Pseudoalteromonas lipolytica LMEB 39]MCC9660809.1 sigma-70 family RNA polymerase sigma factor [Pseudoalteromonas sp. MB41]|tara:strand:- start:1397 stop:1948 length:552 start_codon:yes stop_codon:yes gene_type:complete